MCDNIYRQRERIISTILLTGILGKNRLIRCAFDFPPISMISHDATFEVTLTSIHHSVMALFLQHHGSHPLRERARKLDQGILIIRCES